MSVEIRQLKDHKTNTPFVPVTEWEAVCNKPYIPSKTSDLNNDAGFITGFTETDPTVPAWAKESVKPLYGVSEISGLTEELAGKSNTGHTHEQYSLTGHTHEQYSLTSHTHVIGDVSDLTEELAEKQDVIDDLDTIRSGATLGATALQEVPSDYAKKIQVIDKTSDTGTTFNIEPNVMYMFGQKTNLTINLVPGESGIVNEYMFQFTSGSVATTLNVPSSVVWLKDPDIQTGKKYAVSIENNLGIIGEWSNE